MVVELSGLCGSHSTADNRYPSRFPVSGWGKLRMDWEKIKKDSKDSKNGCKEVE
jgi:hypothetical protein